MPNDTTQPAPLHPLLLLADYIEAYRAHQASFDQHPDGPGVMLSRRHIADAAHRLVQAQNALLSLDPAALRAQAAALAAAEAREAGLRAALTPSTETKAAYMGEFHFVTEVANPAWNEDTDEEEPEYLIEKAVVPWDTIRQIMAAISARAALGGNS